MTSIITAVGSSVVKY